MRVAIVSYPKSGNTLVRFLMANVFYSAEINYMNINKYSSTDDRRPEANAFSIEFYKRHNFIDREMASSFDKIIYIYRNGLDVLKSYRNFIKAQHPGLLENDLEFVRFHGFYYGEWGEHLINSFRFANNRVYLVQYEDLVADTKTVLCGILNFLDAKVSDFTIERALERCSRDNMKLLDGTKMFIQMRKENDYNFVGDSNRPDLSNESITLWWRNGRNALAMKLFFGSDYVETKKYLKHNIILTKMWRYWILIKYKFRYVIKNL